MNLELAKQKLLNTSEYSVHPDADTANEEAESENVSSHAVSHRGNSVTSNNRKSKSPTPSREGSRSPTYKKFHALPDTHQYDYRARPAFHSFHARASTARTGSQEADTYGLSPMLQDLEVPTPMPSVSPERRPGDVIEPRSREKSRRSKSRSPVQYYRGQRINRSRSPSKKASHRKRSRSRSRSRNKSRGHERSRRSRSRSRSRSKTHSRRHHRSRSKSRGHRSRSKSREERSRSRNRRDNRSRSKSSEVDPSAIQQSLMNRLKKAPAKIQINLPIGKETPAPNPVSSNPYHFRNAPDVSKVKAEIEETGKKAKSRWDTSSDIKPVLPPPTLRLVPPIPASIAQTERGVDLHAILTNEPAKTAPPAPDHNRTISDLMATAASMSSATTASGMVQSTTSVTTEAPLVLPPVNLTQPPPVMAAPFGMPPPASMFSMFPFANPAMMTYPQTQFGAPPPFPFMAQLNAAGIPATPAFQPGVVAPVVVDQAELVMRAKMELYSKDLVNLKTVEELIEYLWKQGYDKIPPEDPALLFNEVLKKRKGILGASTLYQIICYGHPELETYYCGMCNHWTTVSEMFNHMTAPMHRMKYMYRNYRKYYEKAEAETDETIKDILLQKFAESIWQIEGSGQCGHRMRCILNQAAIARLWPEYVTCVDNSWKILDLDDEARRQERPSSGLSSTNGNQNRVAISSSTARPADTTIVCDEPMAISPNRTPEKRESQAILHPGIPADLQEQLIKQYLASRSQNIAEQKETRSSDSRRSRERSRERSPSRRRSPERRRERSRSRSRRSRSRSPYSKSSRRDRRRGERESERSSRRSRSKSRSPKPSSSSSKKDKIGDKRGAMELYVSSLGAEQDVPSPAYEALPATEQAAPNTGSFEDRSRNAPSTRDPMNTAGKAMLASDLPSNSRQQASPRPMDAPTRPSRNAPKADDMAKKRKVMGAMVELQSVFDEEGFISAQTVFSVCQEMGIPPEDVITHPLLRQLAITFNVDLDTVDISQLRARGAATPPPPVPNYGRQYEDGARQSSSNSSNNQQDSHQLGVLSAMLQQAQQQQPQEQRSNPSNIDFKSLGTSPQELMDIMRKIGGGNSATAAATVNQLTGGASASGSRPRAGYAQPELNEEVDYVYPGYDDDQMEEERDPCEIESSINRLTFAFSNKKQPMPQQQQHQSPVPRRNTVTQNQQQQRENFQQQRQQQQYQHQQYQQQQYNEEDMEEEEDEEDEEEEHEQQEDVSYFNRQSGAPPQQRQTSQMMAGGQRPPAHQHPPIQDSRDKNQRQVRTMPATGKGNSNLLVESSANGWEERSSCCSSRWKRQASPGNDMRQQPAANSKAYGEYNLNAADPRSNQPPAARGGYPPQRNVAERPKAPQQQYDFTADDDYLQSQGNAPQQGGQPRAGNQGPRNSAAANNYMHVAEQIGDDWNSVDSAVRNLLNPHKK
uniref:Uncharacterized protein n=1 Tax=Ditylenchus dipsaci TaxID=166011 RepID=A0A915DFC3_9BILA